MLEYCAVSLATC